MATKSDVLTILENERGQFVSGQELAKELNISRTAVWKAIKSLEEDGHRILAVNNKGYMLEIESDRLSEEGIRIHMPENMKLVPIFVLESTDSTNTYAKMLALNNTVHGTMVLAEEQTAGRGRYGKSFFSPRGAGLYMSIILKPNNSVSDPQMITIATALAVCKAIEKHTEHSPKIKWVNDIYLDGKKICGILSEAVTDFESGSIESIIVGVGVDCNISEEILPKELRGVIGSLGATNLPRNILAAEIAANIIESFDKLGDKEIINGYRKRSLMFGREIYFKKGEEQLRASVTGINDSGNLMVRLSNGEDLILNSGEVSIGTLRADYLGD